MPAPPPLPPAAAAPAPPAGIELVEVGDWDAGPKRSKWTPEVLNANTLLMPIELPAPFVPDSRLVYARDDLAGGPRSKGGVDDAPAEGAADGEATIDVAGWEFHGGGWKDELQEYASKARL